MTKITFSELYNATKEAVHAAKEPIIRRRNERAIQSAIDSAIDQQVSAEEKLEAELRVVTEGKTIDVSQVLRQRQIITDAEATIEQLKQLQAEFMK